MKVVLDVNGTGYEILVPLSTFEKLPPLGSGVKILTHLQVREDEHTLFGFFTIEERDLFKLLIAHVSGVGPKMALTLLNGCNVEQLRAAIVHGDTAFLSRLKGVGKKTAERIVIELKDKFGIPSAATALSMTAPPADQQKLNDVLLALLSLGYKQPDALRALKDLSPSLPQETLLREALKKI